MACRSRSGNEKLEAPKADIHVCSAADMTSLPGAQEGSFDLAICIYVFCNFTSKEEVLSTWVPILYVHLTLNATTDLQLCTVLLKRLLDVFKKK